MIILMLLVSLVCLVGYLLYLIIPTIKFYLSLGIKHINPFIDESLDIPGYEPAIMSYLVNFQKIGRREICSTLFDLIARKEITIELVKGLVNDNVGEYKLVLVNDDKDRLNSYERILVDYLFEHRKTVTQRFLSEKLYKSNLDEITMNSFLKAVQKEAKKKDFFSKREARIKARVYKVVNKIVTVIASVASGLFAMSLQLLEGIGDAGLDEGGEFILIIILGLMAFAGLFWIIKFLISFAYNITCYYNDFSERGNEDYKRWLGFKRYLKKWSSLTDQPIMSVIIWQKYYAYSIGLKVNKKFFKQMKMMRIMDNSIDIGLFETFNNIVSCIGTSTKKIKSISIDEHGGSHVDY